MRFRLVENILTEGKNIDRTWEQYKQKLIPVVQRMFADQFRDYSDYLFFNDSGDPPIITDDAQIESIAKDLWKNVLTYDPTYKKDSTTTGDYGTWITNMIIKGEFDDYNHNFRELGKLLNEFIQKKSNLIKKDINQYKSVDELKDVLKSTSLSDRQKERHLRNAYGDAKLLYTDTDWAVYQVTTYASACTLGKGTNWCTAYSDNDSYYKDYIKDGNLYVIINLNDETDKYQLFVPNDNATINRRVEMHDRRDGDMHGHTNQPIDVDEFLNLDKVTNGLRDFLENKADIHRKLELPDNAELLAVMEVTGDSEEEAKDRIESNNVIFYPNVLDDEEFGRVVFTEFIFSADDLDSYVDWEGMGKYIIDEQYNGDVDQVKKDFEDIDFTATSRDDLVQSDKMTEPVPERCLVELAKCEYEDNGADVEPFFDFESLGYNQRDYNNGCYSAYGLVLFP